MSGNVGTTPGVASPPAKLAQTLPSVHPLIRSRWSPRSFSSREVTAQDLRTLLEAARWAASSFNEQPWRFLIATKADPAAFRKLLGLLSEGNQQWAQAAPVLMITAAKKTFTRNGAPNRFALHDAGQALANLMLEATALGLYVHAMAGLDTERARRELNIPDDYEVGAAVAIGYLGSPEQLPERLRQSEDAPRRRKPLEEIVFGAGWNLPAER
jgi:nitroreductase